ncbi:PQQ-dependent catabolism-associated beta-propeller protein [Mycobacterium basiliense]|uniref:PQQ-dependent catabolism-associated beta-propeller protein n=1 Tax=Mycobacterium basiliense TaxID=2094119 RepID=A0A447GIK5_9MYCO|nr:YncE family protein [Mycobacterium basiliense]VDM90268.1 PQQ-dependent catabolism-associated beta-propeller protein [Mycobacterium basiliense]
MSDAKVQRASRADRDGGEVEVFGLGAAPQIPVSVEIPVNVEIPVDNGPIGDIKLSSNGGRLLVTNYGDNSVSVIDTDTCRVVETIAGVNEPYAIAVSTTEADRAYISTVSPAYDSIDVVDTSTNTVVASHSLAFSVSDLTVSPDGKYIYASRNGACLADLAVLDTTTGRVEVVDIATAPGITTECVRVSSDGGRVYVATNGPSGGRLVVLATRGQSEKNQGRSGRTRWRRQNVRYANPSRGKDGRLDLRVVATVDIGSSVRDVALSPDGTIAYVASCGADFGAVLDIVDTRTNKITGTRKIEEIGGLITRLTLSRSGGRAYLVSEDRVTVLSSLTHEVIGSVRSIQPSCVIESLDGNYLYIADYSGTVTMTSVASTVSGIEDAMHHSEIPTDWLVPELLQCEPALA